MRLVKCESDQLVCGVRKLAVDACRPLERIRGFSRGLDFDSAAMGGAKYGISDRSNEVMQLV
jgi:hypothetical protein